MMTPLQFLMRRGAVSDQEMASTPDNAFPTMTNPNHILDYMKMRSQASKNASARPSVEFRRDPRPMTEEGIKDILMAKMGGGLSTQYGRAMQRRNPFRTPASTKHQQFKQVANLQEDAKLDQFYYGDAPSSNPILNYLKTKSLNRFGSR